MTPSTLFDVIRAIRRGWVLVVVAVVVCVAAAIGYVKLTDSVYEATAVLTVEPMGSSPLSNSGDVDMNTEQVIASSSTVLAAAVEKLPGSSISQLHDNLAVSIPKGSRVLQFTFTAPTAQRAADGANAIAEAYQTQRTDNAQRIMDEASANLNDLITELEKSLSEQGSDSNSRRVTELQISSIQERLATLASASFYGGSLVSPATPPTTESGPGVKVMGAAGLAVGLLIGFFIALIRDRWRTERELQAHESGEPSGSASGPGDPAPVPADVPDRQPQADAEGESEGAAADGPKSPKHSDARAAESTDGPANGASSGKREDRHKTSTTDPVTAGSGGTGRGRGGPKARSRK